MWRVFTALLVFSSGFSFGSAFDDIEVSGPCTKRGMQVIDNGEVLSVLLHDFGANMPQGQEGDGKIVRRICQFKVRITFPTDQYLAGLTQVFSGGVIKSKLATGQLNVFSRVMKDISMTQPLQWKLGEAIGPESPKSNFTITLEEKIPKPAQCRGRLNYATRLALHALRPSEKEFFIGAVDTIDSQLTQRLDLIPDWQRCDGKPQQSPRPKPRPR